MFSSLYPSTPIESMRASALKQAKMNLTQNPQFRLEIANEDHMISTTGVIAMINIWSNCNAYIIISSHQHRRDDSC